MKTWDDLNWYIIRMLGCNFKACHLNYRTHGRVYYLRIAFFGEKLSSQTKTKTQSGFATDKSALLTLQLVVVVQ